MTGITALELRRLAARPSTGWLALTTVLGVALFGFVLVGAIASLVAADAGLDAATRAEMGTRAAQLAPAHLATTLADVTGTLAPSLGVLAGTTLAAADLRHGLLKLFVAGGAPRRTLIAGKHVAATCVGVSLALVALVTAGACSLVASAGASWEPPAAGPLLAVMGVAAVTWCTFAALGLTLTIAARTGVAGFVAAAALFVAGGGLVAASGAGGWVGTVFSLLPTGLADLSVHQVAAGGGGWLPLAGLVAWWGAAAAASLGLAGRLALR